MSDDRTEAPTDFGDDPAAFDASGAAPGDRRSSRPGRSGSNPADGNAVRLQVRRGGVWEPLAEAPIDPLSRTATFRVPDWDDARDVPCRLAYRYRAGSGMKTHHYEGTVRRDPVEKDDLVVGSLSCRFKETFPHVRVAEGQRFRPKVFRNGGVYTVKVSSDGEAWRASVEGVRPGEEEPLKLEV